MSDVQIMKRRPIGRISSVSVCRFSIPSLFNVRNESRFINENRLTLISALRFVYIYNIYMHIRLRSGVTYGNLDFDHKGR